MIGTLNEKMLDNPIWTSLSTRNAHFAQGGELARRFDPEIGPLAGIRNQSPEAYAELGSLLEPGRYVVLFLDDPPTPPSEWDLRLHASGDQMILRGPIKSVSNSAPLDSTIEHLSSVDIPEMLALTELTKPGPFGPRTIDLGGFIGIRQQGRLAAIAGQRLAWPGCTEVSAVCTHPDFRGRGYAAALVTAVSQSIRDRGEIPMLHTYSANHNAIRLYEALGFVHRRQLHVAVVFASKREP